MRSKRPDTTVFVNVDLHLGYMLSVSLSIKVSFFPDKICLTTNIYTVVVADSCGDIVFDFAVVIIAVAWWWWWWWVVPVVAGQQAEEGLWQHHRRGIT